MGKVSEAVPSEDPDLPEKYLISELIDVLGGPLAVAKICGFTSNFPQARGSDMRRRQSIASEYWPRIVKAAQKQGYRWVTLESLIEAHKRSKNKVAPPSPLPITRSRRSSLV